MTELQQVNPEELTRIYRRRFGDSAAYRNRVWEVLTQRFFPQWVGDNDVVLDLGCGYGEFINNVKARRKYAMDLNDDSRRHLRPEVEFLQQDCSTTWQVEDDSLDVVFTSNFFEHLPTKAMLSQTLQQAARCLRPGGRLIAMGPNIKYLGGRYWDFFDHHIELTESSLGEALEIEGFQLERSIARFLPYTLVNGPQYPLAFVRLYLAMPWLCWVKGRQFMVIAVKPSN
jgi:SAM-dependent methyltransferase